MEVDIITNSDKICRTCLVKSVNMKSLTSIIEGENRTIMEALSSVVNYDIKPLDSYPNQVCIHCEDIILKANAFQRRCTVSQDILKLNYVGLKQSVLKTEIVDIPITLPEETAKTVKTKKKNGKKKSTHKSEKKNNDRIDLLASVSKKENDEISIENPNNSNTEDMKLDMILGFNSGEQLNNEIKTEMDCDVNYLTIDYEPIEGYETNIEYKEENTVKILTCNCNLVFNDENDYKNHVESNNCKKNTKSKTEKKYKTKVKKIINCIDCHKAFDSYKLLKNHRKKGHDTNDTDNSNEYGNYECTKCIRKFIRKSSYLNHVQHHELTERNKYICKTCNREFQYQGHLDNHILAVHSRDKGFTCELCSTNFLTQASLDTHKESHKFEKRHKCTVCNKAFYMLSTLNDHIRIHTGEKPYLCSICGRGFSQKTNMIQHVARHQGLKRFKCDSCEKSFVSKGELNAHKRKHTGDHPFICDECGSGFTTSSALVKHRRTHTGERPYACDLCPMRFAASGTLNNHRRTHTGEKPYQCSYCEKAFVQRQDLVSHIRCHTGERPYLCACGLAFRKAAALKQHASSHPNSCKRLMCKDTNLVLA